MLDRQVSCSGRKTDVLKSALFPSRNSAVRLYAFCRMPSENPHGLPWGAVSRAEAQKEAAIAKAQGQAEATRLMYEAQAAGIRMINEAAPSEPYVQLEGFKYLKDLANGQATKIIVPSNLQGLAGTVVSAGELLKSDPLKVTENVDLPDPDPYKDLRTQHDPKTHKY